MAKRGKSLQTFASQRAINVESKILKTFAATFRPHNERNLHEKRCDKVCKLELFSQLYAPIKTGVRALENPVRKWYPPHFLTGFSNNRFLGRWKKPIFSFQNPNNRIYQHPVWKIAQKTSGSAVFFAIGKWGYLPHHNTCDTARTSNYTVCSPVIGRPVP